MPKKYSIAMKKLAKKLETAMDVIPALFSFTWSSVEDGSDFNLMAAWNKLESVLA